MKEFIIKDDPIHLREIENKEVKKDFSFVTNDDKSTVKVTHSFGGRVGINWPHVEYLVKKEIIFSDIENYDITHKNYINYLDKSYSCDCGIVIRPDFIWFTILCEISSLIKSDPETFKKYFSNNKEKEKIIIHSDKKNELPIDEVLSEVLKKLPTNITEELIVPKFTTLDDKSKFAFKCAFLDTVSPYFGYGIYYCGYNKIKVLGEQSDYSLIGKSLQKLSDIIPELKDYYDRCIWTIDEIIMAWNDVEFWKNICKTESGYISRTIDGWIKGFYLEDESQLDKYPEHLVKVNYSDPGNEYTMYVGILSSKLEDGYLIPEFNKIIAKTIK